MKGYALKVLIFFILILTPIKGFADSPCLEAFRSAFVDYGQPGSPRIADAQIIYAIYYDSINGMKAAFTEAEPIFRQLGNPDAERPELLQMLQWFMRTGDLCNPNGEPKTIPEVVDLLREKLTKSGQD
jgi:hypothetical protein